MIHSFIRSIVLTCLLMLPLSSYAQKKTAEQLAQEKKEAATKVEIEKQLKAFAAAYSQLGKTKDVASVVQYMAPDVTSTLVTFNISDRGSVLNSDYNGFVDYLNKIVRTDGLKVDYNIKEILKNTVTGSIGIVIYVVEYSISKDAELWSKGTETVSMVFRQEKDNSWKIAHYSVIGTEDERIKGVCSCELYKASSGVNTGNYMVKTVVPKGKNYSTLLSNFEFMYAMDGNSKERLIIVGENTYQWEQSGEIYRQKRDGSKGDLVVKAHPNDEVLAIISILQSDIYVENCTKINVRR